MCNSYRLVAEFFIQLANVFNQSSDTNFDITNMYWVDAKVSADFFSFLCFKFLLKQNTINQQRIYHCYL